MRRILPIMVVFACLLAGCGGGHNTPQSATGSVHPPGWGGTPKGLLLPRPLTGVPSGTMFDAVTLSNVPGSPFAVAGYVAGNWPTWFRLAGDFPSAHRVSIAIHLGQHAMCGDFEPGDMASSQAGQWAKDDIAAGFKTPCAYGDLSNMPTIQASLRASLGLSWRTHVLLWLAWYRHFPGLIAGYDGVQYDDHCLNRSLDCSTVTLDFLRIAVPPYAPPPTLPKCYTHRITKADCDKAKAQVKAAERGAQQSLDAYRARGCDVLKARERWFADAIRRQPHSPRLAYRKGALAATKRAESRQQCGLFAGRVDYFLALENRIRAAN